MKKIVALLLTLSLATALVACSNKETNTTEPETSVEDTTTEEKVEVPETSAVEVLNSIWGVYADEDKFACGGGDSEQMVMDTPGAFDPTKTEELDVTLALPADQAANIDDAASLMHMMNANTFTGAAYHVIEGTDVDAFASAVKDNLNSRQWMCGFPEKFVIFQYGDYVITAFGNGEIIQKFHDNANTALEGMTVLYFEDIVA